MKEILNYLFQKYITSQKDVNGWKGCVYVLFILILPIFLFTKVGLIISGCLVVVVLLIDIGIVDALIGMILRCVRRIQNK